jgi:hypothetical protein
MKNFTTPLTTFTGEEIKEDNIPITFSSIAVNALMGNYPEDKDQTGVQKLTRFKLAERIFTTPATVELSEEEKKLITDLVDKQFSILVVGKMHQFLLEE